MSSKAELHCLFCKGECRFVYKMDSYRIYKCLSCGTGQVFPMPDSSTLKEFYDGFLFSADPANRRNVFLSAKRLFPLAGLLPDKNFKMLDVGGGGGFYSAAFEELGYGKATYVDLDIQACKFAGELGLKNVLHGDVTKLGYGDKKFDFIMCRHLIEHLIDPVSFIQKTLGLLTEKGLFLLICPNGNSLEYFAYPGLNLGKRIDCICRSNSSSKYNVIFKMLAGNMLHGIDPPRHLWAITAEAVRSLFDKTCYNVCLGTYPLSDREFSPYYQPRLFADKIYSFLGKYFTSKLHGGTHLAAIIRRS